MKIKVIKDQSEYQEALQLLSDLMDKKIVPGSTEENTLELLLVVLKEYEQKNVKPIDLDPVEAIKFRMEQSHLTQKDLIPFIGSISKVSEVLSGKRTLSISMIRKLHKGLDIPLESLIGKKVDDDLLNSSGIDYSLFPLKEMKDRGCFGRTKKSLKEIKEYAEEYIKEFCGDENIKFFEQNCAFLRAPMHQRGNRKIDKYALFIWQICVLKKAKEERHLPKYDKMPITESWLKEVIRLSALENGPDLVKDYLRSYGIIFVTESPFEKTYLDGAAIMYNSRPIIALTLRHRRIDNFWFVLAHEIAHLIRHLDTSKSPKNMQVFLDNLDVTDALDKIELEADAVANEALIPREAWNKSRISKTTPVEKIREFAEKLQIHPAIVAGRIRYEQKNYRLFPQLVKEEVSLKAR